MALEEFKEKVRDWWIDVEILNKTNVPPSLKADKDKLLARARTIRRTIDAIPGVSKWFGLTPSTLGLLPLVPVAVISATTMAVTKWVSDYVTLKAKVKVFVESIGKGQSPEQARENVNAITGSQGFKFGLGFGSLLTPLLIVGAFYFLSKK